MDDELPRRKERDLTQAAFAKFLAWLDPSPDEAGKRYEVIRRRLIKMFICRGCDCPEELTDETINRVIIRIQDIGETYIGDPALYFYGVAHHVHLEFRRKKTRYPSSSPAVGDARPEAQYECLEECIAGLMPRSRELVLRYYQEERQAKIKLRKQLAMQLGIPLNALRIRACRIRTNLLTCMLQCLQGKEAE